MSSCSSIELPRRKRKREKSVPTNHRTKNCCTGSALCRAVQCSIIAAVCNSTVPGHHCHSMGTVTVFFHDLRECTSKRAKRVGVPYHSILPHNGVVVITICTTPISFMAFRLQNFGLLFLCCCSFHLFQFVLHYVVIYSFHSN